MLGLVEARLGGEPVDLGTPRQRAIVAALALSGGRTVPVDTVIARVWTDRPPSGALATLHGYVAALRRALEPDRAPRAEPRVLVTDNPHRDQGRHDHHGDRSGGTRPTRRRRRGARDRYRFVGGPGWGCHRQ